MRPFKDTGIVTVAAVRRLKGENAAEVLFNEREQIFTLPTAKSRAVDVSKRLQHARKQKLPVKAVLDPLKGVIERIDAPSKKELAQFERGKALLDKPAKPVRIKVRTIDPTTFNIVDRYLRFPCFRLCTKIIPSYKKAKQIFEFCAAQSCHLPGPPTISPCIPFQYVRDGCYARAHKMRKIITEKYGYCCEKVFSFANANNDQLAVKADKWGGCCVTWWYHVAPFVRVRIKIGPIKFVLGLVIDPSMFDKPVLLSTWLTAQENASCASQANVSMYSIQPGSAYWPDNYQGTAFGTDPTYTQTDSTLIAYKSLITCP